MKPFGLVLYMRGHGWVSMSSNLIDNELEISEKVTMVFLNRQL